MTLLFPAGLRGIPSATGPRSLSIAGSSSRALAPSSESLAHSICAVSTPRAFHGVAVSLSRHQATESTYQQASHSLSTFRPRRFSRPRRLTPRCPLRVCFTSQPRLRFTPQGFPPAASRPRFHTSVPSCRLLSFAYRQASLPGPAPDPRLQGFTPTAGPL